MGWGNFSGGGGQSIAKDHGGPAEGSCSPRESLLWVFGAVFFSVGGLRRCGFRFNDVFTVLYSLCHCSHLQIR